MLYAHFFLKDELFGKLSIPAAPRQGERVRFKDKVYLVAAVVWIFDEESPVGQRVDIAIEPEKG